MIPHINRKEKAAAKGERTGKETEKKKKPTRELRVTGIRKRKKPRERTREFGEETGG